MWILWILGVWATLIVAMLFAVHRLKRERRWMDAARLRYERTQRYLARRFNA